VPQVKCPEKFSDLTGKVQKNNGLCIINLFTRCR